jgi:hypothetical protein
MEVYQSGVNEMTFTPNVEQEAAANNAKLYDVVGGIIAWEDGGMDEDGELKLFEHLVASGMIHHLQGCYGRRAHELGLI